MSEVADLLERAADVIRERGWAQGSDVRLDGSGPVCIGIALQDVGADGRVEQSAVDAITTVVPDFPRYADGTYLRNKPDFPGWNDHPERTVEDVLLALKKAAYEARK